MDTQRRRQIVKKPTKQRPRRGVKLTNLPIDVLEKIHMQLPARNSAHLAAVSRTLRAADSFFRVILDPPPMGNILAMEKALEIIKKIVSLKINKFSNHERAYRQSLDYIHSLSNDMVSIRIDGGHNNTEKIIDKLKAHHPVKFEIIVRWPVLFNPTWPHALSSNIIWLNSYQGEPYVFFTPFFVKDPIGSIEGFPLQLGGIRSGVYNFVDLFACPRFNIGRWVRAEYPNRTEKEFIVTSAKKAILMSVVARRQGTIFGSKLRRHTGHAQVKMELQFTNSKKQRRDVQALKFLLKKYGIFLFVEILPF